MQPQVAALEPNDHDTMPHPADPIGSSPAMSQAAAVRFQHASGEHPLAGYTIKRGVGQGGFGEIYYALSDAGKEVALKLIRRNLDVELRGIRQCLNLKHPNLLDIHDIRKDDQGDTWVVMEYVADPGLDVVLAQRPSGLPPEEALAWIHGIGAGVAYLHDRGIVHRDLKPGNIFCDEGIVKVGDYGLSKFISCSRRSGHTESIGTVHYMAPEVANGRYGKEIDVYAMGVILYELLTGRVPFEGESIGEVLMKHLTAKPDVSMLPEPYRGIVARALEKDPEKRYRSAAEMMAALPPCPNAIGPDRLLLRCLADASDNRAESAVNGHADDNAIEAHLRKVGVHLKKVENHIAKAALPIGKSDGAEKFSWPPLATMLEGFALLAIFIFQFVLLEEFGSGMRLLVLMPLLFLLFYFASKRILWGKAAKKPAKDWASSHTVVLAPPAPPPSPPKPQPVEPVVAKPAVAVAARQAGLFFHRENSTPALVLKPPRERIAELLGSLLISTFVAAAMSAVMVLLHGFLSGSDVEIRPEHFAWLMLVGMAGAWAVLVPSKLWEGVRGEPMLRRFILMVIGMGVGLAAFGLGDVLMVSLPVGSVFPHTSGYKLPPNFYSTFDGHPLMMAYVACFGTLFLLMRWWLQADPLRSTRLSLWSVAVSVLVAGLAAQAWQFPQPWLPMAAATISVSVQLASPWCFPSKRKRQAGY